MCEHFKLSTGYHLPSKEQPVDYEASCHHTWPAAVIAENQGDI